MSNCKVHIASRTEVFFNGKEVTLEPGEYTLEEETFCLQNNFMQCGRCKDWFDEVSTISKYHPQYNYRKQLSYCEPCFNHKYE